MQLTRKQIHEQVYFYTLILIAISLPLSVYTCSMFQFLLAANWLVEGRFREKWRKVVSNRALQVFLLIFALHLVGLLWSEDLAYGLKVFRVKPPLLGLPVIIATSAPLDRQRVKRILLFFSAAVFVSSMASMLKLAGLLPGEIGGYRDLSLFVHHIRFSLMFVLGLLISFYFLVIDRSPVSKAERIYHTIVLIWFSLFLLVLKILSGIVVAGLLAFFLLLRALFEIRDRGLRFMALVPLIMIPLGSILYLNHAVKKFYTFDELVVEELDPSTIEGNPYEHWTQNEEVENGHYVWIYVCDEELEREWNSLSSLDYRGRTSSGNSVRTTLIRFLASKGLRKDATGVKRLSDAEIRTIEEGTANHIFLKRFSLYPRIYEVIWEFHRYRMGYAPNDKSVVQRYLYLQAGWSIAREHLLVGVGNGDVLQEFKKYYESVNSPLVERQRRGPHNQYLTELIAFGIPGFLIFLTALVAPLFLARRQHSFMATGFLLLLMISMLSGGTLDSATGAAFGALFYSLFLFGPDFPWLGKKSVKENG
ncbi:MAG: O-antigen ligase family protein [Bacteroidota bacterium]|nr:O-antigen ligase family protein [Bacteroidota bacterium]